MVYHYKYSIESLWFSAPEYLESEVWVVSAISNLLSELCDEHLELLSCPAQYIGHESQETLSITCGKHNSKLANFLQLGVLRPRAKRALRRTLVCRSAMLVQITNLEVPLFDVNEASFLHSLSLGSIGENREASTGMLRALDEYLVPLAHGRVRLDGAVVAFDGR